MSFDSSIEALFRSQVILHSAAVDNHAAELGPRETEAAGRMVEKRLREFSTGRFCAHKALAALDPGYATIEIPIGENREPLWPQGSIGSITHDRQLALAVVSRDPKCLSLGIDLQPFECLTQRVSERIASEPEISAIALLLDKEVSDGILKPPLPGSTESDSKRAQQGEGAGSENEETLPGLAACLLFSIKESIFKCYFPVHRVWIDFKEATVFEPAFQPVSSVYAEDQSQAIFQGSYRFTFKRSVFERMRDKGIAMDSHSKLPDSSSGSDGAEMTDAVFHGRFLVTTEYVVSTAELTRSVSV